MWFWRKKVYTLHSFFHSYPLFFRHASTCKAIAWWFSRAGMVILQTGHSIRASLSPMSVLRNSLSLSCSCWLDTISLILKPKPAWYFCSVPRPEWAPGWTHGEWGSAWCLSLCRCEEEWLVALRLGTAVMPVTMFCMGGEWVSGGEEETRGTLELVAVLCRSTVFSVCKSYTSKKV